MMATALETTHRQGHWDQVAPTSLVESSHLVEAIMKHPVLIPYELLQNALDYNDWSQGKPEIIFVFTQDSQKIVVDYEAFLSGEYDDLECVELSVSNFTNANMAGLTPDNVVHLDHIAVGQTLGIHGQGGTGAAAAAVAGGFCEKLVYVSHRDGVSWSGEGSMQKTRSVGQDKPNFTLFYSSHPDREVSSKTSVTFLRPKKTLLDAFRILPENFLPANKSYPNNRIFSENGDLETLSVAFAQSSATQELKTMMDSFSEHDEKRLQLPAGDNATEIPRVELFPSFKRGQPEHVFVDGLLVNKEDFPKTLGMSWGFWGFSNAAESHQVVRSPVSVFAKGDVEKHIGIFLEHCENDLVFRDFFNIVYQSRSTVESWVSLREASLNSRPKVILAMKNGWKLFLKEHGYNPEKVVLSSNKTYDDLCRALGYEVIKFESGQICAIIETFLGVVSAQDVMNGVSKETKSVASLKRLEVESLPTTLQYLIEMLVTQGGQRNKDDTTQISFIFNRPFFQEKTQHFADLPPSMRECIQQMHQIFPGEVSIGFHPAQSDVEIVTSSSTKDTRATMESFLIGASKEERQSRLSIRFLGDQAEANFQLFLKTFDEAVEPILGESGEISLEKWQKSSLFRVQVLLGMLETKEKEVKVEKALSDTNEKQVPVKKQESQEKKEKTGDPRTFATFLMKAGSGIAPRNTGTDVELAEEQSDLSPEVEQALYLALAKRFPPLTWRWKEGARISETIGNYLVAGENSLYSSGKTSYEPFFISRTPTESFATLTIERSIVPGSYALPIFINHEPTAIYHQTLKELPLVITKHPTMDLWQFEVLESIPTGLQIGSERLIRPLHEKESPEKHRQTILDEALLKELVPEWMVLVEALRNDSNLSPKDKNDILLQVWKKWFTYSKSAKVEDHYSGLALEQRCATTVARGVGNCGYAAEGLLGLLRAVDVATIPLYGYLGKDQQRTIPGPHNHAFLASFVSDQWVNFDPRGSYLDEAIRLPVISEKYFPLAQSILAKKNVDWEEGFVIESHDPNVLRRKLENAVDVLLEENLLNLTEGEWVFQKKGLLYLMTILGVEDKYFKELYDIIES